MVMLCSLSHPIEPIKRHNWVSAFRIMSCAGCRTIVCVWCIFVHVLVCVWGSYACMEACLFVLLGYTPYVWAQGELKIFKFDLRLGIETTTS